MTFVQLQYLVTLARTRHFAKAAEECFVSQPTLSTQVKKLEDTLGVAVFNRTVQPLTLTEIGESIVLQAKRILAERDAMQEIILEVTGTVSGECTIGIIPTLASSLLPRMIGKYKRMYPNVTLHIREMTSREILQALEDSTLDIGLMVTPLPKNVQAEVVPILYEEILLYCRAQDLPEGRIRSMEDLDNLHLWLLHKGNCFQSQSLNLCRRVDKEYESVIYRGSSFETLIKLVDREGGYTFLPELTANDLPKVYHNNIFSFPQENPPVREVSLVKSKHFVKHRVAESIVDILIQTTPPILHFPERGEIVEWDYKHLNA